MIDIFMQKIYHFSHMIGVLFEIQVLNLLSTYFNRKYYKI